MFFTKLVQNVLYKNGSKMFFAKQRIVLYRWNLFGSPGLVLYRTLEGFLRGQLKQPFFSAYTLLLVSVHKRKQGKHINKDRAEKKNVLPSIEKKWKYESVGQFSIFFNSPNSGQMSMQPYRMPRLKSAAKMTKTINGNIYVFVCYLNMILQYHSFSKAKILQIWEFQVLFFKKRTTTTTKTLTLTSFLSKCTCIN